MQLLDSAMNLPGVRTGKVSSAHRPKPGRPLVLPTVSERATIYLLLAEVQAKLAKSPSAPEVTKVAAAPKVWLIGSGMVLRVFGSQMTQ